MTDVNNDQKEFWNGTGGSSWVSGQEEMESFLSPFTEQLMAHAVPAAGERVLDIGCGTGDTSLKAAKAVGDEGSVFGVDISKPMLTLAKERATAEGVAHAAFAVGDAQVDDLGAPADLVMSRFGVMFFEDPTAAFKNIHKHTKPGGRMVFACWQPVRENEWVHIGLGAAKKHVTFPPPPDPHAPGPFAFADSERTLGLLADAGWKDAKAVPYAAKLNQGSSAKAAAESLMLRGPISRVMADKNDAEKAAVMADLTAAMAEKVSDGNVMLGAAIWVVSATA